MAPRDVDGWRDESASRDAGWHGAGVLTAVARRSGFRGACHTTTISTAAPATFDFPATVYSHGWALLAPNRWDPERGILERTESLGPGRVVRLAIGGIGSNPPRVRVAVTHRGELRSGEARAIRRSVRRMLRLDEDLAPFHELCRRAGPRWSGAGAGKGRLLRSPTVFEDAVKTICTTNIQWGGTKAMVDRLVRGLGEAGPPGGDGPPGMSSFPSPEAIASADGPALEAVRLGYRAPYVRDLSERVAAGELDLEALLSPGLSTREVRDALLAIKGIGPYAAATMLMLLGRYDHLAVDTVFRSFVSQRYFGGRTPSDGEAMAVYADWGRWKYLGYWLDLWQGLHEEVLEKARPEDDSAGPPITRDGS